ncbi:MAG: alpha/beta fold hydrolase [Acholeplasmataceae bacterium]|nr:MAG: alpha/beta fold hydrolase [Acholeplasmataceae bacterium]
MEDREHARVQTFVFEGYDDQKLHGFILRPLKQKERYQVIIHYHGYSYHRGDIADFMPYLDAGYAVISFDIRNQGGKSGPFDGESMFQGLTHQDDYYYRKVYIDAVKVIDIVREVHDLENERIALTGFSQGGAMAIVAAALDRRPKAVMVEAPAMSDFPCRIRLKTESIQNMVAYCAKHGIPEARYLETLTYYDVKHLIHSVRVPVLVGNGTKDPICPVECFQPTFNMISAPKQLVIYQTDQHDEGGDAFMAYKIKWLNNIFSPTSPARFDPSIVRL